MPLCIFGNSMGEGGNTWKLADTWERRILGDGNSAEQHPLELMLVQIHVVGIEAFVDCSQIGCEKTQIVYSRSPH
jgi:hypothetical protein